MADVRLTVKAATVRFPRLTQQSEFGAASGDVYINAGGGDRFGVALTWNVEPATWRKLSAQLAAASTPGNLLLFDLFDATSYKRVGDGAFQLDANAPVGAAEVMLENAYGAADFLLSQGTLFTLNGQLCIVTGPDAVGSASFARRQLRLQFTPPLRRPAKRGDDVEATNPVTRLQVVGPLPSIGATGRVYGRRDVPWKAMYTVECVEWDPPRPLIVYDPVTQTPTHTPMPEEEPDPEESPEDPPVRPEPDVEDPDPNMPPTAVASPEVQQVAFGALVTLRGDRSWDPERQRLSYQWTQTHGAAVALSSPNAANPTFRAPNSAWTGVFQLVVTDSDGAVSAPAHTRVLARATDTRDLPPDAVLNLTGTPQQRSVVLTWTLAGTGGPVGSFRLRINEGAAVGAWRPVNLRGNNPTQRYEVRGLKADTDYTAEVQAVGVAAPPRYSASATDDFKTKSVPVVNQYAGKPAVLAPEPDVSTALLRWTAPGGAPAATGYEVQYGPVVSGRAAYGDPIRIGAVTSYAVRGLGEGSRYDWRVRSLNGDLADPDGWVDGANFLTLVSEQEISAVRNLASSGITQNRITWSWDAPAMGTVSRGYRWSIREIGIPGLPGGKRLAIGTTHNLQVVTSNLKPGTEYRFFVSPLGPGGGALNGPLAQTAKDSTLAAVPAPAPPTTPSRGAVVAAGGADAAWAKPYPTLSFFSVTLDGSATGGSGGFGYAWEIVGNPPGVGITQNGQQMIAVSATKQNVTFRLTATDSLGASDTDDVVVS